MSKAKASASGAPVITCRPVLPVPDDPVAAAKTAISINPANAPPTAYFASASGDTLSPLHAALATARWWGVKGVDLSVQFLDNPSAALRKKILAHMNAWSKSGNVRLRETKGTGQCRISRQPGSGYASYVGTDNAHIPTSQPTMWLDSFSDHTPDSEFFRVVRHETGHLLGLIHEHQRKNIIKLLDPAKTIAVFERLYGWDETTTRQQVLTPVSEKTLTATPVDVRSIMAYQFSSDCTKNGKPIPGGLDIDASDYALVAKIYPKSL
jgi:hypothetical protein